MSSLLRIEASKANGAKSHGPVTPEGKLASALNSEASTGPVTLDGKARSAQNAIRHGILTGAIVLDTESSEQFAALLAQLHEELQPEPGIETRFVEVMAIADWRRMRLWCIEREEISREIESQNNSGLSPVRATARAFRALCDGTRSLDLLQRYETKFDRQYLRTLAKLEAYREQKTKISEQSEPNVG